MKTASNKTPNFQSIKTVDPINENSPTSALPRKKHAGNSKLRVSLRHLNQAYDEQLTQARRLKSNSIQLEESLRRLKETCVRYEKISQNLSVRKLRRKLTRLSQIMGPYSHSKS